MNRRRRYCDEDEYYSKDYGDTWLHRIGGLFVAGVVIAVKYSDCKGD